MIAVLIGIAVFAIEVIAYCYVSHKVQMRRLTKRRLASLIVLQPAERVNAFVHNRPGEN